MIVLLAVFAIADAGAQKRDHPLGSHLQFTKIESNALKGNLIGEPYIREMAVLLPPSYFRARRLQYPVVYLLHGLGKRKDGHLESVGQFVQFFNLMKDRKLSEVILVAVDGTTIFGGSYYADSPTIGNFEEYVAVEIVSHIDTSFRTRSGREWRAIAGFSMGGHGAIKIGMKRSDVFSQIGSLSGSPLSMRYRKSIYKNALARHKKPKDMKDLVQEITYEKNWSLAAAYAKAAAFSSNVTRPPLYLDLPFESTRVDERDPVWQKWLDDDPLSLVARYQKNLQQIDQIYLDHGEDETTLGTEDFLRELVRYGLGHNHYIFRGDHVDDLFVRYVRMIQFLSTTWQSR